MCGKTNKLVFCIYSIEANSISAVYEKKNSPSQKLEAKMASQNSLVIHIYISNLKKRPKT